MKEFRRPIVLVIGVFVVALAALIVTGVNIGSTWATFVPDLIVGVVGAGAISATIAWVQYRSDLRRSTADRISAAYDLLISRLQELIHLDMTKDDAILGINRLHQDMRRLSELVVDREPTFEVWFEAEQQLGMFRLKKAVEVLTRIGAARTPTPEENMVALEQHSQWISEFSNNVRYWRTGNLSAKQMREQATTIETGLRELGGWCDDPMPWRNGH